MTSRLRQLRSIANRWLEVHHPDPDVARRGQLLNFLLLGMVLTCLAILIVGLSFAVTFRWAHSGSLFVIGIATIALGFALGLYALNRSRWMRWAPILFVLGLLAIVSVADDARAMLAGGSATLFIFPIVVSSVLLWPSASFAMTVLVALDMLVLAWSEHIDIPLFSDLSGTISIEIITYFGLALVSWLSARSVEKAFADLRQINRELDRRVTERTQSLAKQTQALAEQTQNLAETLIQVQIESAKNQAVLESITDGVIVLNDAGTAIVANPTASQLLDTPASIVGKRLDDLLQPVTHEAEREQIVRLVNERLPSQSLKVHWGGHKVLSIGASPIDLNAGRQPIGTVVVCRDFTHEAELARIRDVFISMISHELRSPLVAIVSQTELLNLAGREALTEPQHNSIQRIALNARRLLQLVNDLLDQSRIEAGATLTLHPGAFWPTSLIDEVLMATQDLAQAKHLQLTAQISPALPRIIVGDSQRLLQILTNLVTNAIKYTDSGHISVELAGVDDTHWRLQVSDTGRGIPVEAQAYIYDPFRQVQAGAQAGAGLGLTIVKHLVDLMHGEIKLASQVGQGSTFTVILPLAEAHQHLKSG